MAVANKTTIAFSLVSVPISMYTATQDDLEKNGLLIQTMLFQDDIKELPKTYNKPEISNEELSIAKTLINSMNTPFDAENYKDEYQEKLKDLIGTKIQGKEVVEQKEENSNIIDLMEALKKSVEKETA